MPSNNDDCLIRSMIGDFAEKYSTRENGDLKRLDINVVGDSDPSKIKSDEYGYKFSEDAVEVKQKKDCAVKVIGYQAG